MRTPLSRRQRAAAASMGMLVGTVFSLIFLFYGWSRLAVGLEILSAVLYTVWVYRALRRFFISRRRANGSPEKILRSLVGHASQGITDRCCRFGTDAAYGVQRREWIERCGLGFTLPPSSSQEQKAASR
jgi:hypothetical protein